LDWQHPSFGGLEASGSFLNDIYGFNLLVGAAALLYAANRVVKISTDAASVRQNPQTGRPVASKIAYGLGVLGDLLLPSPYATAFSNAMSVVGVARMTSDSPGFRSAWGLPARRAEQRLRPGRNMTTNSVVSTALLANSSGDPELTPKSIGGGLMSASRPAQPEPEPTKFSAQLPQ